VNKLEVPEEILYNNCMLNMKDKKKELVIELNMFSEWFSRGERGIDQFSEDVNVDLIRKVWDDRDEEGDIDEGVLNSIESRIVYGDGGFIFDDDENYKNSKRGVEGCMSRIDMLLEGKSILIECEEEIFCIGSKNSNEVEIDYCKFKMELLKG
jgi:hypothetical protein